jgi:hypothetical protein
MALDHGDFVTIVGQPPRGGHADHTGTHDRYAHPLALRPVQTMGQSVEHPARLAQCQYVPEYVLKL